MKALAYLNKYLAQHKNALLLGLLYTLLSNLFSILPPRLVRYAFDLVQDSITAYQLAATGQKAIIYKSVVKGLIVYSILVLVVSLLKGLFSFLTRQSIMITGKRIEYALKNEIYNHYQTLPLSFYRRHSTGDLMARISEDVNRVGMYLGPSIMYIMSTTVSFLMLIPYMLTINPRLTLYAAVPIPFLAAGTYYVSTFLNKRSKAIQSQLSKLTTFVQESFTGIRVIQAFAGEPTFRQNFVQACHEYKTRALRLTAIHAIFFPAVIGIIGLGIIIVVFVGGQEVIQGNITSGNIAEFIMYLYLLGWPTFSVSWITNFVQRAAASQQRINEFLQQKTSIVSQKNLAPTIQGHIAFRNVSFTYPDSGVQALKNLSFEVRAGQAIAIIGPTGSGKTTIANLLSRFYDVDQGVVLIDNVPIQDYAVAHLRKQIGYVPQDVFLFSDTIANNITFGTEGATMAQMEKATQQANIAANIQQLPKKMETVLGERGVTLSGGQKQRIAIARAFIRDPRILVLDDCLSAVDTQTEKSILQTMAQVMKNRTTIIISHRLASARLADHILVLDKGEIVEQGDHDSLLARQGVYYTLHQKQQFEHTIAPPVEPKTFRA